MSQHPDSSDPDDEHGVGVVEKPRTKRPRRYQVVLHNDDYTTMEFVVDILVHFFHKNVAQAQHIMLHVHHKGFGVVDTFTRDVAETKADEVMKMAREAGHPLRCTAEPESQDSDGD